MLSEMSQSKQALKCAQATSQTLEQGGRGMRLWKRTDLGVVSHSGGKEMTKRIKRWIIDKVVEDLDLDLGGEEEREGKVGFVRISGKRSNRSQKFECKSAVGLVGLLSANQKHDCRARPE